MMKEQKKRRGDRETEGESVSGASPIDLEA